MISYQSKGSWVAFIIFLPLILIIARYEFKVMTSTYNKDLGNGVVIYADDYVKSGLWVFDCKYRRLVSRQPLPTPFLELKQATTFSIGKMYTLQKLDIEKAKKLITSTTALPEWHNNLHYRYSVLDEDSELSSHVFGLITNYEGKQWALEVSQDISYNENSSFQLTAEPYNPETYTDYAKAFQAATKSCPKPQ